MLTASIIYILFGFGVRGGYPHWSENVRTIYVLLFPIHAVVFQCLFSRPVQSVLHSWHFWGFVMVFVFWTIMELQK